MQPTHEFAIYRLKAGTDRATHLEAQASLAAWVSRQPGFLSLESLESEDGTFLDHVRWESLAHAEVAGTQSVKAVECAPLMGLIDMDHLQMFHMVSMG